MREGLNPTMQTYTMAPIHASGCAIRFPTTLFAQKSRIRTRQWRCIPDKARMWAHPLPIAIFRKGFPCAPESPSNKAFAKVAAVPSNVSRRCEKMWRRCIRFVDRYWNKEDEYVHSRREEMNSQPFVSVRTSSP